ncbi:MAG: hypothetical protein U0800_23905 [Isosphaeraceae bacterium]
MRTNPIPSIDPGKPDPAKRRGPDAWRLAQGFLWLAAVVAALLLLVLPGGLYLAGGTVLRAIAGISQPDLTRIDDTGRMMAEGATLAMAGASLAVGSLILSVRAFAGRSFPRVFTIAIYLAITAALAAGAGFAVRQRTQPGPAPAAHAGLEGVWYDDGSWSYRFNPDFTVDGWSSGSFGGGRVGTWSRSGATVTFRSDHGWQITGTLQGSTIQGNMSQPSAGMAPAPITLTRKVRP